MNVQAILAFAAAALSGAFSAFTLARNPKSKSRQAFAAGMGFLAIEQVLAGLAARTADPDEIVRFQQWKIAASSALPGIWLLFSFTYARGNAREFWRNWRLIVIAVIAAPIVIAALFRGQLAYEVSLLPDRSSWLIQLGWSGMVVQGITLLGSILILTNLERTFAASVGTMRWRIKSMLLGVGALFVMRLYTSSEALLFRGIQLSVERLDTFAALAACMLMLRSLYREGHFEVDVYPSQSVLRNSITTILAGAYLVIVGVLAKITELLGGDASFALKSFIALASIVILAVLLQSDRLRLEMSRFVSRNFQRPLYDYRTVWLRYTQGAETGLGRGPMCRSLSKLVAETFHSLSVSIWLMDEGTQSLALAASTFLGAQEGGKRPSPEETASIAGHFRTRSDPADIEDKAADWATALREMHPNAFAEGGDRVCAPLASRGEVIGLITIGDRVGGASFTVQDFDMLRCIANHSTASLQNPMLSEKILQSKELEAFQMMAAFFVHDLKNAASSLNLMLKNLPEHFDNPEFRKDSLRGVGDTVSHINRLIGRLSALREGQRINPTESDLNEVVCKAVEGFERNGAVALSKSLSPLPCSQIDRDQFSKVVTNLVLNATEAVGSDGWVRVETINEANWNVLMVTDNGCGIPAGFLRDGLFRPFQTTKKGGLGIGMFQSKMIVDAHGGRMCVKSEPGKGTRFQVFVPVSGNSR